MSRSIFFLILPIMAMIANVLTNVAAGRLIWRTGPVRALFAGYAGGLAVLILVSYWAIPSEMDRWDIIGETILAWLTYSALSYGYFHFVNINVASLRIRILREVSRRPGDSMESLMSRYNVEEVLAMRVMRLMEGGHLREENGRLFVAGRAFLWLYEAFEVSKLVLFRRGNRSIQRWRARCLSLSP